MPLAPPENQQTFESLEDLILRVNEHAAPQGYAVVLLRTKKSKLKVTRKAGLICDRGQKHHDPTGQKRKHTTSGLIKCLFSLTGKLEDGYWLLDVVDPSHNHPLTLAGAHPVHRKMAMDAEIHPISLPLPFRLLPSRPYLRLSTFGSLPLYLCLRPCTSPLPSSALYLSASAPAFCFFGSVSPLPGPPSLLR